MLKNKQKNMKMRSSRMRDLNSSEGSSSFAASFWTITTEPWYGTAISPDFKGVTNDTDPSTFISITFNGQGIRKMFDRRTDSFIYVNAYLFNVEYTDDSKIIEVQVNPEFSQNVAYNYALQYAYEIGKLPTALRNDVETVSIHNGDKPFGGGNDNLLIHVKMGEIYINSGVLEEILIHEAAHTSLDFYESYENWKSAKEKDNKYISTYARENPIREDIAESFLAYFAIRYRKDRITDATYNTIMRTIPNRIEFFDSLNLKMFLPPKFYMVNIVGASATQVVYKNTFLDADGKPRDSPIDGGYTVLSITSSPAYGTAFLSFPAKQFGTSIRTLIVGGGGGAGSYTRDRNNSDFTIGGGGGAGGVYAENNASYEAGKLYPFYVGQGGIGSISKDTNQRQPTSGQSSQLGPVIIAGGGGAGGTYVPSNLSRINGSSGLNGNTASSNGCGGGGGIGLIGLNPSVGSGGGGGSGASRGASGANLSGTYFSGGGGGADPQSVRYIIMNGRNGISSDITGTPTYYGGGGGGLGIDYFDSSVVIAGSGGLGGGGNASATRAQNGVNGTGGGGGTCERGFDLSVGGNGGSGVIIVRYPTIKYEL
jgi:hypothetical protein